MPQRKDRTPGTATADLPAQAQAAKAMERVTARDLERAGEQEQAEDLESEEDLAQAQERGPLIRAGMATDLELIVDRQVGEALARDSVVRMGRVQGAVRGVTTAAVSATERERGVLLEKGKERPSPEANPEKKKSTGFFER